MSTVSAQSVQAGGFIGLQLPDASQDAHTRERMCARSGQLRPLSVDLIDVGKLPW